MEERRASGSGDWGGGRAPAAGRGRAARSSVQTVIVLLFMFVALTSHPSFCAAHDASVEPPLAGAPQPFPCQGCCTILCGHSDQRSARPLCVPSQPHRFSPRRSRLTRRRPRAPEGGAPGRGARRAGARAEGCPSQRGSPSRRGRGPRARAGHKLRIGRRGREAKRPAGPRPLRPLPPSLLQKRHSATFFYLFFVFQNTRHPRESVLERRVSVRLRDTCLRFVFVSR